jgi:hypothetical protein
MSLPVIEGEDMTKWTISTAMLLTAYTLSAQEGRVTVPKIWDDKALEDWATPIAALGVRPSQFTAAEYYVVPGENLRTYPVYRPDREPPGYWEWLQKQKPQPLVDPVNLRTRDDWIKAGEIAFQTIGSTTLASGLATADPEKIKLYRDPKAYEGVWTRADGSLLVARWVVTDHGIELRAAACAGCHARAREDGTVFWAAPRGPTPGGKRDITLLPLTPPDIEPAGIRTWHLFTVPWAPDERIESLRDAPDAAALVSAIQKVRIPGVVSRPHGNPYYQTKIPDLNSLQFSRYMDATATHRLRGPEDVARYAAFISGIDPMDFGKYKILKPEQRRITFRYADEVLYAIGAYLMSLEPPKNPDSAPAALIVRGRQIFARETCINCHVQPNYTSGKLTLAEGYKPPPDHPNQADIVNISVGTDPGLAMKTRKGTGFYKIPSLRGVWYRPLLLHDGSVASLEEMFDPDRLKPDHVPGGWIGPGMTKRTIPGHPFGLVLKTEDKAALLAFLRSL